MKNYEIRTATEDIACDSCGTTILAGTNIHLDEEVGLVVCQGCAEATDAEAELIDDEVLFDDIVM